MTFKFGRTLSRAAQHDQLLFEQEILSDDGSHAAGSAELRDRDGKVKQGEQELLHARDSVGQNSGATQYGPSRIDLRLAREFRIRDPQVWLSCPIQMPWSSGIALEVMFRDVVIVENLLKCAWPILGIVVHLSRSRF